MIIKVVFQKIKEINLNKPVKFNKLRELSSSEEKPMKKIHLTNKSLKKVYFDNSIKADNLKYDSEIFNQEEIAKSFRHSYKNNINPFINIKKK